MPKCSVLTKYFFSSTYLQLTGENSADLRRSLHGDNICSSLWLLLYGEYPLVGGDIVVTAVIMGLSTSISLESGENVPLDLDGIFRY